MSQLIYNHYNSLLVSQEMNTRFADFLRGSVLSGYRVIAGTSQRAVTLSRGTNTSSVMITQTGVRIEETADLIDIVTLNSNGTVTDRIDSIYAAYVHGEPVRPADYVVIVGDAAGNPAPLADKITHTLLGYVKVPASGAPLTPDCFTSMHTGLAFLELGGKATLHGDVSVEGKLTLGKNPVADMEAATKAYVDAIKAGLFVKDAVRATTTANISLTGLQTIDGVTLSDGDRVLVRLQTSGAENGIYAAHSGAWIRAVDADNITNIPGISEVKTGIFCFVSEGAIWNSSGWALTTPDPIIIDTTSLNFTQFSSAGQSIAGEGLKKEGNQISVVPATPTTLGSIKKGDGLALDVAGVLSADLGDGLQYDAGVSPNKKITVNLGSGLYIGGVAPDKEIIVDFTAAGGDNGTLETVARGNHLHDGRYYTQAQLQTPGSSTVDWGNIVNEPLTYPPSAHTHPISDINTLQAALDAKQNTLTGAATSIASADLTVSRALASDGTGKVAVTAVTATELGYLSGVTSVLQTQLNAKQATLTGAVTTIASADLTASRALTSDVTGKVAVSNVTATELSYLSGVTSAIQTQLNSKQATITGAASTIDMEDLTPSRALIADVNGKVAASAITYTELGYLAGLTNNIQTQLDARQVSVTGAATSIISNNLTTNIVVISDSNGKVASSTVPAVSLQDIKDYNVYASNQDIKNYVYKTAQYKRADGTIYLQTDLSNPDVNNNYQTLTMNYYDAAGTTVTSTKTWTLTYDDRGNVMTKVLS